MINFFFFLYIFGHSFDRNLDREKRSVNCGDEPGLKNQVLSDPSAIAAALNSITDSKTGNNNGGYVPTVGRWGSEWPSWLENTSFGEQRRLSPRTQSHDGVCSNHNASGALALTTVSNAAPKQQRKKQRCRIDVVGGDGAEPDVVTADDLTNQLQFLKLKTKWTIDEDKYNADAFDQCEGAWPIAHPLPLPLWSNTIKQPFVVENVSYTCFHISKLTFVSILTKALLNEHFSALSLSLPDLAIWRSCGVDWCNSTSITGGNSLQHRQ